MESQKSKKDLNSVITEEDILFVIGSVVDELERVHDNVQRATKEIESLSKPPLCMQLDGNGHKKKKRLKLLGIF